MIKSYSVVPGEFSGTSSIVVVPEHPLLRPRSIRCWRPVTLQLIEELREELREELERITNVYSPLLQNDDSWLIDTEPEDSWWLTDDY